MCGVGGVVPFQATELWMRPVYWGLETYGFFFLSVFLFSYITSGWI